MALPKSARVEVRVTETEKEAWAQAAGGTRKVSEWLRSLANAEAFGKKQLDELHAASPPPGPHAAQVNPALMGQATRLVEPLNVQLPPLPLKVETAGCPRAHFHRPGTYCGSCKQIPK